ncbi:hypothetical protein HDV05_002752 [Chytridiales sp. JEL 0842]|nr:hypothetical protein HDV05_002752 [Chytridiales sp. JEL 0842]
MASCLEARKTRNDLAIPIEYRHSENVDYSTAGDQNEIPHHQNTHKNQYSQYSSSNTENNIPTRSRNESFHAPLQQLPQQSEPHNINLENALVRLIESAIKKKSKPSSHSRSRNYSDGEFCSCSTCSQSSSIYHTDTDRSTHQRKSPKKRSRKPLSEKTHESNENIQTKPQGANENSPSIILPNKSRPNDAKTDQLIEALEREELQRREREKQYAAQVLMLQEQVSKAEETIRNLELQYASTEKLRSQETEEYTSKEANLIKKLKEVEQQLSEWKSKEPLYEDRVKALEATIDSERKISQSIKEKATQYEHDFHKVTEDHKAISAQLIKEREAYKVKIAELVSDSNAQKNISRRLQKDLNEVKQELKEKEETYQTKLMHMNELHHKDISTAVATATNQVLSAHKDELARTFQNLEKANSAYAALEIEYRQGLKQEQQRCYHLEKELNRFTEKFAQERELLNETRHNESELRTLTKELTKVVKEQQQKIAELTEQKNASFMVFEEKIQHLENSKRKRDDEIRSLKMANDDLKAGLQKAKDDFAQLEGKLAEKNTLDASTHSRVEGLLAENKMLRDQIDGLTQEHASLKASMETDQQAFRVKVKMLEDQNGTIRNLKQNLENKMREQVSLTEEFEKRRNELETALRKSSAKTEKLEEELQLSEAELEKIYELASKYRTERDILKDEVESLTTKLTERNERIIRIEEEVERVKEVFARKEEKLTQERNEALNSNYSAVSELRQLCESQALKIQQYERDRSSLVESLKDMQAKVQNVDDLKRMHEGSLKALRVELDKQRSKFSKLKQAMEEDIP